MSAGYAATSALEQALVNLAECTHETPHADVVNAAGLVIVAWRAAIRDVTPPSLPNIEPWQVPLWERINEYTTACGGDPSKRVYGNTTRMAAVAAVNTIVRKAVQR